MFETNWWYDYVSTWMLKVSIIVAIYMGYMEQLFQKLALWVVIKWEVA